MQQGAKKAEKSPTSRQSIQVFMLSFAWRSPQSVLNRVAPCARVKCPPRGRPPAVGIIGTIGFIGNHLLPAFVEAAGEKDNLAHITAGGSAASGLQRGNKCDRCIGRRRCFDLSDVFGASADGLGSVYGLAMPGHRRNPRMAWLQLTNQKTI